MTVEEHYGRLLQLPPPWEVTKVEESLIEQRVTVWLRWPDGVRARCPECGEEAPVYDRLAERTWRHLSVMQYRLELRCATPRCRCEKHGVKAVRVPWAEPGSRFTLHFEAFAVAVIAACRSLSQAAKLLGLHWDSVQRIPHDSVKSSLKAHLSDLLTYFTHRITNALTEGFNSKIQATKADARGFRRFENYRTGILFFCGKLDLAPHVHSPVTHTIPRSPR